VRRGWQVALLLGSVGASFSLSGCLDAVHDDEVQALGPEVSGVPAGPLHRPGQPCLTCHGGIGPASTQFSAGGTLYALQGQSAAAISAMVQIEDILGNVWTGKTNAAGNFYVLPSQFSPHYPTQMTVLAADAPSTAAIQMMTVASRDGSCADCHKNPAGPTSPGPVYVEMGSP
jgi:hypothetical protein